MKKIHTFLLLGAVVLSLFFNVYRKEAAPPAFNADEAAFGYNAYSILQTGKDEYGTFLPLRLKSFGDYKMPLYSYLSIPFIATFGLNESSTRMVNTLIAVLFPIAIFFLCKELFNKVSVGLVAAYLVSFSLGLHIVGRHAHEAYLATFLITLACIFFIRVLKKVSVVSSIIFLSCMLLALFSYQSSRIFAGFFFLFALIYLYIAKKGRYFIISFFAVLLLFLVTDILYAPSRIQSLLFFNNPGFSLKINEFRGEGGSGIFYNKVTIGVQEVTMQYVSYLSPEFLIKNGDRNYRFGFPGMAPVTIIEYFFFLVGIYFLFKNKEKWRYLLIGLLVIAPISGALSWAEVSLTRVLFLLIPLLILCAYGFVSMLEQLKGRTWKYGFILLVCMVELFFLFYAWQFYLNHYPKRAIAIRSWQPGYKTLSEYLQKNYNQYDQFFISRKNGQPYIFLLFYSQYPPKKYQAEANLSKPDQAGFGQVEQFDKYNFNFAIEPKAKKTVSIGYPDDFSNQPIDQSKIKKITAGTEEIFWIYENK